MPQLALPDECAGCLACIDSCREDALTFEYKSDGFFYPKVEEQKCINCGVCEKTCPIINGYSYKRTDNFKPIPFAAWSTNDEFRMKSSSGGAFPELAKVVLEAGGIVIGAVIDGLYIKHIAIDNILDLPLLQGSKYLQSDTNGIYFKTYNFLKDGKTVLFSGTPCHIGALQSFLSGKIYSGRLYCIDLICHGVPSRLPIDIYNSHIGNKLGSILRFRSKESSWLTSVESQHCKFCKDNNEIDEESSDAGRFQMGSFISDLTLRMSCYDCKFAHFKRSSDLTLADFWQVRDYKEEHKKGVSLVVINTPRGESLLQQTQLQLRKTNWGKANLWLNSRFFRGINRLKSHPARQLMALLMHRLSMGDLKRMYALINCDSEEWRQYKMQYTSLADENYVENKKEYFKFMLKEEEFVNIISTQLAYNYGSVLQSFSLKQVIENFGYDVRFINLKPDCYESIAFNWKYKGSERIRDNFARFRKLNFPHSLDLYDINGNCLEFNERDIFVVGSDQVWNIKYTEKYYREFFLSFVSDKNKKISYAASFGVQEPNLEISTLSEIKGYLERFYEISCREKSGVDFCADKLKIDAVRVLDPTLLGIDYSTLFNPGNYKTIGDELVFAAFGVDRLIEYGWIKYVAKELDLNVRVINGNPAEPDFLYSHYVTIDEWLSRLYNATLIVTNSFHVMSFAIVFKKSFIIVPRSIGKGENENEFSRFESLFSDLGIEGRFFSSFEEIKSDQRWRKPLDYQLIYKKLEPLRQYSLNFLKQALEK